MAILFLQVEEINKPGEQHLYHRESKIHWEYGLDKSN